jgi:hypothetical protein
MALLHATLRSTQVYCGISVVLCVPFLLRYFIHGDTAPALQVRLGSGDCVLTPQVAHSFCFAFRLMHTVWLAVVITNRQQCTEGTPSYYDSACYFMW